MTVLLSTSSRRRRSLRISLATMLGFSVGAYGQVAKAQNVPYTFSGIVNPNITDACGLFGPVGGSLSGQFVQIIISYNAAEFIPVGNYGDQWQPNIGGAMTTSLIINGVKYGFSTGATSDDLIYSDILLARYGNDFTNTGNAIPNSGYAPNVTVFVETGGKSIGLNDPAPPLVGTLVRVPIEAVTPASELCGEEVDLIVGGLNVISPFLLGKSGKGLDDLNLNTILPNLQTPDSATALAADGTSAAIVLFQVPTTAPVTFTTSNGTTLLQYDPRFLTYAPQTSGGKSLIVPSAKIITVGSALYAAALIQAPAAGVTPTYSTPIVITAQQKGGQLQQAYLPLVPPPVLLVHGLWGNADSLSDIGKYLNSEPPWNSNLSLVFAVSYPGDLAFDSKPTTKDFSGWVNSSLANVQSEGVVAGRVDLVAHSMGGLVARHFSGLSSYINYENRLQGAFHQIITLNTPEQGSEVATFLINYRMNTVNPQGAIEGTVISELCPNSVNGTVEDCLTEAGKPLGPNESTGAVYSLQPASQNIADLPSPNIPNAAWNAISSTVSQSYYPQASALLFGLNYLIVSACSGPQTCGQPTAPDIEQILGTSDNDAVVPNASQTAGCVAPCQIASFKGRAHTKVPDLGVAGYVFDNRNIEDDPAVNETVGCWLSTGGGSGCGDRPIKNVAYQLDSTPRQIIDVVEQADQFVVDIPHDIRLAAPFDMLIESAPTGLSRATVEQRDELGNSVKPRELEVRTNSNGIPYASIVPTLMGRVTYIVRAYFQDGSMKRQDLTEAVGLPSGPPREFRAAGSFSVIHTSLDDCCNGGDLRHLTRPHAVFDSAPGEEIDLGGRVTYSLLPSREQPAIRLNQDGSFDALRAGKAVVEERFGTAADTVTIIVDPQ